MALQAETTELATKDFTTKSFNMWKTDELTLYPQVTTARTTATAGTNGGLYQAKVSV